MIHAEGVPGWRRNLVVCTVGAFTTVLAMTVLLPILPTFVMQLAANRHASLEPAAVARWSAICFGATYLAANHNVKRKQKGKTRRCSGLLPPVST